MENSQKNTIEKAAKLIEELSPAHSQAISTIALVHWNNIINHCSIENLGASDTLLISHLLKALALANFEDDKNKFYEAVGEDCEVEFTDSVAFLSERQKNRRNKKQP